MSLRGRKTLADELNEIRSRVNKLETGTQLREDSITLNTIRVVKERYNFLDSDSLSLWLTMNGSARDKGSNKFHGTLVGSPLFSTGQDSQAIDLDGVDDEITVPSDTLLNIASGNDISWSFWVKTTDSTGEIDIIGKGLSGGNHYFIRLSNDIIAGGIRCRIWDGADEADRYSAAAVNDGNWHHITTTYDASTGVVKIYVDGVDDSTAIGQNNATNQVINNTENFNVGKGVVSGGFFDGEVDETRVYKRLLSEDEVLELFTYPKPQPHQFEPEFGLRGYYPFEAHQEDMSGFVNNGTRVSLPSYVDGVLGKAMIFDGVDDGITISDPFDNDLFTISCWVKVKTQAEAFSQTFKGIVGGRLTTELRNGIAITATNFIIKNFGGGSDNITIGPYTVDAWHHVVVTYDGTDFKGYIDRVLQTTTTSTIAPTTASETNIGFINFSGTRDTTCDIDEVRFYDRVLSLTEITNLFDNIKPSSKDFSMDEVEAVTDGACQNFYLGTNPGGANNCDLILGNQWKLIV